jgi:hypothetical protein
MFDIDVGKFISRSLGIGEESTDEAVKLGASIATGDIYGGVVAASQLLASEKARSKQESPAGTEQPIRENMMYETGRNMYRTTVAQESGGYIDIPSTGQIYEGFVGQIPNIVGQIFRTLPRGTGGVVGGAAGGVAAGLLGGNGDACGCQPKAFVRFNKCGDPIITRAMKKQAIEAVNCSGAMAAAETLTGGDVNLLNMIVSKQFPPKRMGISGAQLNTTMRTMTKLDRAHKKMQAMCKPTRTYTRRK